VAGFDHRRPLPRFRGPWRAPTSRPGKRPVVLFADTFNNWFEPENLVATVKVLEATGHRVIAARGEDDRPLCCGRTYLTAGMMSEARAEAKRTIAALKPHLDAGTPVVGLEPSCILGFRDEYAALFPGEKAQAGMERILLVDEYLARGLASGELQAPWKGKTPASIRVHGHCRRPSLPSMPRWRC
jgi:Fe-S oxidoreductase